MEKKSKQGDVLIVEDDSLLSLVEERLLIRLGYNVVEKAETGKEAIKKTKEFNPDIILMDISLKGEMDGIETMGRIRKFSNVPVIFLSGNSDKHNMEQARKLNMVDYLVKPISADQMEAPLKKAMKYREKAERISAAG